MLQIRALATATLHFPMVALTAVAGCTDVYHCGYRSEATLGGSSYFIKREAGNILFDSPTFNPILAKQLEEAGGVQHIVISHIDHVGDQDKWSKHFGAPTMMHQADISSGMTDIAIQLTGGGPWNLKGDTIASTDLDEGVQVVHTPGHTAGSISLWHEPSRSILSGDHLGHCIYAGAPSIFERYNRGGVSRQLHSVQKLLEYDFLNVLPGHGKSIRVNNESERKSMVEALLKRHS